MSIPQLMYELDRDPGSTEEPYDRDMWRLNQLWTNVYAGDFVDAFSDYEAKGWKTDWLRASKLVFLWYLTRIDYGSSKDLPRGVLNQVVRWLEGQNPKWSRTELPERTARQNQAMRIVEVRLLLTLFKSRIWARAETIALTHDREYYARVSHGTVRGRGYGVY